MTTRDQEMTMSPDQKQLEAFRRDGFVHLPEFMDAAEMDCIEVCVAEVIAEVVPTLAGTAAMYEDYERPETLKPVSYTHLTLPTRS